MRLTQADLDRMVKSGQIQGYKDNTGPKTAGSNSQRPKAARKPSAAKIGFKLLLDRWTEDMGLPLFQEQRFHISRKWRLDFLIPTDRGPVALEYEGMMFEAKGHQSAKIYTDNARKYNTAAIQGITVLRYTFENFADVLGDLDTWYFHTKSE